MYLIPVALLSPQMLSAGHGALHAALAVGTPLAFSATIFTVKCAASIIWLDFGFRGELFFASLFLGTLVGHVFADSLAFVISLDAALASAAIVYLDAEASGDIFDGTTSRRRSNTSCATARRH